MLSLKDVWNWLSCTSKIAFLTHVQGKYRHTLMLCQIYISLKIAFLFLARCPIVLFIFDEHISTDKHCSRIPRDGQGGDHQKVVCLGCDLLKPHCKLGSQVWQCGSSWTCPSLFQSFGVGRLCCFSLALLWAYYYPLGSLYEYVNQPCDYLFDSLKVLTLVLFQKPDCCPFLDCQLKIEIWWWCYLCDGNLVFFKLQVSWAHLKCGAPKTPSEE